MFFTYFFLYPVGGEIFGFFKGNKEGILFFESWVIGDIVDAGIGYEQIKPSLFHFVLSNRGAERFPESFLNDRVKAECGVEMIDFYFATLQNQTLIDPPLFYLYTVIENSYVKVFLCPLDMRLSRSNLAIRTGFIFLTI